MTSIFYPELLAKPVPRYTSYPTAAEFTDSVGRREMQEALGRVATDEPLSLYVHIPYCHEICWYCGCNTGAANKAQRLASYLDALKAEIGLVSDRLNGNGQVRRIAFGGGSPNSIDPRQFADLLNCLQDRFGAQDALLSIELDPRSLSGAWFDAIRAAVIGRASLGVQTLEPEVQARIGRIQPLQLIQAAVDELRRAGVRSLNFDLMYGLPGQSLEGLDRTLCASIEMRPERIALFGYAHVPHLIPRQRRIDDSALPDNELRFRQAQRGREILIASGYEPIGFDHFALPHDPLALASCEGRLARNFQGFTDDSARVTLGLGASAISQFPGLLVQNEKNPGRYRIMTSSGLLPAERGVVRNAMDRERGRIIERLLCDGSAEIGSRIETDDMQRLEPFLSRGLASIEDGRLNVVPDAWPYLRTIASQFDTYRHPTARRFSSAI